MESLRHCQGQVHGQGDLPRVMADGTAKKRDPEKWEIIQRKRMGGHSARAMQLATRYYKEA